MDNKYLNLSYKLGLFLLVLRGCLEYGFYVPLPDSVYCILSGMSASLILVGIISMSGQEKFKKLRAFKKSLFTSFSA